MIVSRIRGKEDMLVGIFKYSILKMMRGRGLPGGLVIKTPPSITERADSIPGWETKISHATQQGRKIKKTNKKVRKN